MGVDPGQSRDISDLFENRGIKNVILLFTFRPEGNNRAYG